jgi:penicillin-binding protein 2
MIHRFRYIFVLVIILGLAACGSTPDGLPLPADTDTRVNSSDVKTVAQAYLDAWTRQDYASMYEQLSSNSKLAISGGAFRDHYLGVFDEAALTGVDWEILSVLTNPDRAQVAYQVILHSGLVGDIKRDTEMNLVLEGSDWRVQWDDTLVLPELKGSNYLVMSREDYIPARANIYDYYGHALVAQADATAIGLYPDQIDPAQQDVLFSELETLTGLPADRLLAKVAEVPVGSDWYLPIAQVPAEQVSVQMETLSGISGLALSPYRARYYFDNGVAPHVLGTMGLIDFDELQNLAPLGYTAVDRVGKSGIEKWGEPYLAGKRGGALYVFNGQGQPVTRLAETLANPGSSIYTTLDRDFQLGVQEAIAGFRGAVVVMERDTGRILAMASSPNFDPNAFEPVNYNSDSLQNTLDQPDQPLLNRATQGLYPLGSIFKIIVMATALESGEYTPRSTLQCGYRFEELGESATLYDWTYEHFQADKVTKPSGPLTLSQGLIRSCNIWFYHIGLDFYRAGKGKLISDMAANFGLGHKTGITGVEESIGNVPIPQTEYDATNLGIGQGDLLVTPLQVAAFIAAIGNGGTLYRPQIVEAVVPPDGRPLFELAPEAVGSLPLSPANLEAIQEAMVGVIRSTKPTGTAWHQFTGLDIQVAGKTGTATSGSGAPHAWFAGYTFENREGKPDIAVAVILENAGEGSAYAAPVFRRVVELYFSGQPQKLYEWESTYGTTRTPVP